MQQENRHSIKVQLMDGRSVDICTESGANSFLKSGSKCHDYMANNVEKMSKICAKRKLSAKDKGDIMAMNLVFDSVAQYGSHNIFRKHFEHSTIKAWLAHVIEQIQRFTTNRNWITTGNLSTYDTSLLNSCISMMCHAVPVAIAFETEFFNVLADFVKARKGNGRALPCADIADTITLIVSNAYNTSKNTYDNTWTTEKSLKKLEATGVLEQFIRCATVPQAHDFSAPGLFRMLDEFQACIPFISKKLLQGQPCGEVAMAILEGRDGSRVQRPSVINRLKTMLRFATSIDPDHKCGDGNKMCRKCCKSDHSKSFQSSLMKCARCHQAYYCSRECQKSDWKEHKKTCITKTKSEIVKSENIQQTFTAFCTNQYVHIMVKMVEACEKTGLTKDDMLVELNFKPNQNGIVPAMQDKPEFKIAPVKDYINGSRPAEPDWFFKNQDRTMYDHNIKGYLATIKDQYSKMRPNHLLCLTRYEGGFSCYKIGRQDSITNKETFSQEAVLAFQKYMNDDDDGPLSNILDPGYLRKVKRELRIHYNYGPTDEMPDEETIRDALDALRMYEESYG
ncbi:unnamed protein product [Cylindrotheca closterium]|uniref:MYND-type domain-containing protein n=1 Tax=Cylindrotheca closterium TaxID=2856 RepID=A0AAD2CPW5_9STRA|nr:unnamed protein product [Cylindrotheca closterium]